MRCTFDSSVLCGSSKHERTSNTENSRCIAMDGHGLHFLLLNVMHLVSRLSLVMNCYKPISWLILEEVDVHRCSSCIPSRLIHEHVLSEHVVRWSVALVVAIPRLHKALYQSCLRQMATQLSHRRKESLPTAPQHPGGSCCAAVQIECSVDKPRMGTAPQEGINVASMVPSRPKALLLDQLQDAAVCTFLVSSRDSNISVWLHCGCVGDPSYVFIDYGRRSWLTTVPAFVPSPVVM
jgi:hypothetical protein